MKEARYRWRNCVSEEIQLQSKTRIIVSYTLEQNHSTLDENNICHLTLLTLKSGEELLGTR